MQEQAPRQREDRHSHLMKVSKPDLQCQEKNPVARVCLNPHCPEAMMCEQEDCPACGDPHIKCNYISLGSLTKLANQPLNRYQNFIDYTIQIEEQMVRGLQSQRKELQEKYPLGSVNPKFHGIIDQIFNKNTRSTLSGKQAKEFYEVLVGEETRDKQNITTLTDEYTKAMGNMGKRLMELQELAYQEYVGGVARQSRLLRVSEEQRNIQAEFVRGALQGESRVELLMRGQSSGFGIGDLQRLLEKYTLTQPSDMVCDGGNPILRMCVNLKCQNTSLFCKENECNKCISEKHKECDSILLEFLTSLLNKRSKLHKDFVANLFEKQNAIIEELQRSRQSLADKYYLGNMNEEQLRIVTQIYRNKNKQYLKGEKAHSFINFLKAQKQGNFQQLSKVYELQTKWIKEQLIQLKQAHYNFFVKNVEPPRLLNQLMGATSLITQLSYKQYLFMHDALRNPKQLKLLFRASEHNFRTAAFHQHCDNIEDTFTIIRTQFGRTIAGFTHYKWNVCDGVYKVNNPDALLLQLDLLQKMVPTSDASICCKNGQGPCFGGDGSYDIRIYDSCNANTSSYSNFPYCYNLQGPNKYTNNQQSYTAFSGATSNSHYKVLQYEVYRVLYN